MQRLLRKDRDGFQACKDKVDALEVLGHKLERPLAAPLRDKIHELRARRGKIRYRILYFFDGQEAVVLTHGITKKEDQVPETEIDRAVRRRETYLRDRKKHGVEVRL